MNAKTAYKVMVSLILVALLIGTGGSVTQASAIGEKPPGECDCCEQTGAKHVVGLSLEDPYLVALQQTAEAKSAEANFGTLLWDQALLQSTEDNPWQVITIPIENNRTREIQLLLAGTEDGKAFRVLVFGLELEKPKKNEASQQSFDGSLKFYAPTGELVFLGIYQDGRLQEFVNQTNEVTALGLNWGCFLGCIGRTIPTYCLTLCAACAVAPVPTNPLCIGCAACIGYGAFACILFCWQ